MTSADILFNLFPSTFPPHHLFLFPASALFLLGESFFSFELHLTGDPCDYLILSLIEAGITFFGMHVLHCLVLTNQYLEETDRKFNLFNKTSLIFLKI